MPNNATKSESPVPRPRPHSGRLADLHRRPVSAAAAQAAIGLDGGPSSEHERGLHRTEGKGSKLLEHASINGQVLLAFQANAPVGTAQMYHSEPRRLRELEHGQRPDAACRVRPAGGPRRLTPPSVGVLGRPGTRRPTGTFAEALLAVLPSRRTRRPPHPTSRTGRPQAGRGRGRPRQHSMRAAPELTVPARLRLSSVPNEWCRLHRAFRLGSQARRPARDPLFEQSAAPERPQRPE